VKPVGKPDAEICTSGLMSGDGKRGGAPASVLAPILDSTRPVLILEQELLVNQSGNVGQKPRPYGCARPQHPS